MLFRQRVVQSNIVPTNVVCTRLEFSRVDNKAARQASGGVRSERSDSRAQIQSSLEIGWHSSESHSARASPRRGGNSSVSRLSGTATAESMLSK